MSETTFVRFHEYNDNEGESWDWWLQLDGNEDQLTKLDALLAETLADDDDPWYRLHLDNREPESVVDKLVHYADFGYFAAHTKVTGRFVCPESLGEDADLLYKGRIRGLFQDGGQGR